MELLNRAALLIVLVWVVVVLSGCETIERSVAVKVPVPVYCSPQVPRKPVLPVDSLVAESDEFSVTRALWATVEVLEAYATRLKAAVDSCSEKAPVKK